VGTAVFDLGAIKDINLTNQPVTPGFFKFGGVDLFPVVEQKCGSGAYSNKGETAAQGPITLELGDAGPKTELQQARSSTFAQLPAQAPTSDAASAPEHRILNSQSESTSCGDGRKPIYVADGLAVTDGIKGSIEIAVSNNGNNSEFIILESQNNKIDLIHKGKIVKGKFIFASLRSKQEQSPLRSIFTPVHSSRQNAISLVPKYIKPHRDGTGAEILYLSGLRQLFASKESGHRIKFDGNPPSEILPEAFYFDRCE
jgi:hypothetical protein